MQFECGTGNRAAMSATRPHALLLAIIASWVLAWGGVSVGAPFVLQGPGVDTNDFRVTTFASGVSFPLGMAQLSDGSLLVTVVSGTNYFNGTGSLIRLTDTNFDGV